MYPLDQSILHIHIGIFEITRQLVLPFNSIPSLYVLSLPTPTVSSFEVLYGTPLVFSLSHWQSVSFEPWKLKVIHSPLSFVLYSREYHRFYFYPHFIFLLSLKRGERVHVTYYIGPHWFLSGNKNKQTLKRGGRVPHTPPRWHPCKSQSGNVDIKSQLVNTKVSR